MAIDKLTPASSIIAAMRAELNKRAERTIGKDRRRADAPELPPRGRGDVKVLRQQLVELVRPVAIDDPEAVRALRPKIVRAILLWEFGAELREHPEWQPMLASITRTLEERDPHQAHFAQLLADLKR